MAAATPSETDEALAARLQQEEWAASASSVQSVGTLDEFDAHLAMAGRHKPVIVDFTASWCGPCKMISPAVEQLAERHGARALFLKVDVDEAQEIAQRAAVRAMPTFHVYLGGEKVDEMTGASAEKLAALVSRWIDRAAVEAEAAAARAKAGIGAGATARTHRHAPATSPLLFAEGNAAKMVAKLEELNGALQLQAAQSDAGTLGDELSAAQLEAVRALAARLAGGGAGAAASSPPTSAADSAARTAALALLQCAGGWPSASAFPAVDLLRLAVLSERERPTLVDLGAELVRAALDCACGPGASETTSMLGLRLLANCCAHPHTAALLAPRREAIVERAGALLASAERPGTRLAAATLVLNLAVLAAGGGVGSHAGFEARVQLLATCAAALEGIATSQQPAPALPSAATAPADEIDAEVAYRLAVTASSLCLADGECAELAQALGVAAHALAIKEGGLGKRSVKLAEALAELAAGATAPQD